MKYGSDHLQAREILREILEETVGEYAVYARKSWREVVKKYMIEEAQIEPAVTMGVDENWMVFTLRYVVDYKARRHTKDRLLTRILERFGQTGGGVAIAFMSTDINVTDTPVFNVRFAERGGEDR